MGHTHVDTAILGAGFSGLGAAIRLDQAGRRDLLVLEGSDAVGGTWRDNAYPGAACDVRSHLYSFSFAQNPDWSRRYAPQDEIRRYLEACVDRFGLRDRIRLGTWVERARWDGALWQLALAGGDTISARVLIAGIGPLRIPRYPSFPGQERFAGPSMHSARWDQGVDLAGKRVGVVGTGASAIQIVPELAKVARSVHVHQRTPSWVIPRDDAPIPAAERALLRIPGALEGHRFRLWIAHERRYLMHFGAHHHRFARLTEAYARGYLRWKARDPALRAALTPDDRIGCKRILLSDDWYDTLVQPHVHVETRPIRAVEPEGLRLDDGSLEPLDVLVYCTGFQVDRPLGSLTVTGRDGRDLATWWGDRPRAHLGITVPGFPNLFLLLGPNTALGHSSVLIMLEGQLTYLLDGWRHIERQGPLEVREEALRRWLEEVDARTGRRVWASGCDSWYLAGGRNIALWPGSTARYLWRTRRFDPEAYQPG